MAIATSTFLTDSTKFIRDAISTGVTDPITSSRPSTARFVMTSYPQRAAIYPLITVRPTNITDTRNFGQGSEGMITVQTIEVRVWARNVIEQESLTEQTYNALRSIQLDAATGTVANGLYDFKLTSAVRVDEPGDAGIHSMVMQYKYMVLLS